MGRVVEVAGHCPAEARAGEGCGVREEESFSPGVRPGKSLRLGSRSGVRETGIGGATPTSGFMTSGSTRAFPSLRQWSIESEAGLGSLGSGEERALVPGLWG